MVKKVQTSLQSNCLCQAVQVEKKETEEEEGGKKDEEDNKEKGEEAALEKEDKEKETEEEKGSGLEGGSKVEKEDKTTEEQTKAPRDPRRPKTMQIKVTLLDDTLYECELDVRAFLILIFSYIMHTQKKKGTLIWLNDLILIYADTACC